MVGPTVDVSSYMVLMVPGLNVTCTNSQRFAIVRVNLLDMASDNITKGSDELITPDGGWSPRMRHIDDRGPEKYDCRIFRHYVGALSKRGWLPWSPCLVNDFEIVERVFASP